MEFNLWWKLRCINVFTLEERQKCLLQIDKVAIALVNHPAESICGFVFKQWTVPVKSVFFLWTKAFLVLNVDFELYVFSNLWVLPLNDFDIQRVLALCQLVVVRCRVRKRGKNNFIGRAFQRLVVQWIVLVTWSLFNDVRTVLFHVGLISITSSRPSIHGVSLLKATLSLYVSLMLRNKLLK